jgi:hypothetical protein
MLNFMLTHLPVRQNKYIIYKKRNNLARNCILKLLQTLKSIIFAVMDQFHHHWSNDLTENKPKQRSS